MCKDSARPDLDIKRASYLSQFVSREDWYRLLHVHPDVPDWAPQLLTTHLQSAVDQVTSKLALNAESPNIYVYPSVESLREHSCASPVAVAYYDGAIHAAVLPLTQLLTSLQHEYVHHVLMSNGIGKPFWFQEGAAMKLAYDAPRGYRDVWRENPIQLAAMVDQFPKTADLDEAVAYYAQAYVMMDFLERLCEARPGCGVGELAKALVHGRTDPDKLFGWATAERGRDLMHTVRVTLWDDYVAHGHFPPETRDALYERKRRRPVGEALSRMTP